MNLMQEIKQLDRDNQAEMAGYLVELARLIGKIEKNTTSTATIAACSRDCHKASRETSASMPLVPALA